MKHLYLVIFATLFIFFVGAQNFTPLNSGVQSDLTALKFFTEDLGYCIGHDGTILKTVDGGLNWTSQVSGTTANLTGIYFENSQTGYITGRYGTLLHTTNGGTTWNALTTNVSSYLRNISKNGNDLFVCGEYGVLQKSSDNGLSWTTIATGTTNNLYDLRFTDSVTAFMTTDFGGILKSIDGGNSWTALNSNTTTRLFNLAFQGANNSIIVGGDAANNSGVIVQTQNGGNTWNAVSHPNRYYGKVSYLNSNTAYIVGGDVLADTSVILKTIDAGQTWELLPSNSNRQHGIYIINNTIFTCGLGGTILKSSNTVGIRDFISKENRLQLYPNPSHGTFKLKLPKEISEESFQVAIYNELGQQIFKAENLTIIDLGEHAKGVYYVHVRNAALDLQSKIILR